MTVSLRSAENDCIIYSRKRHRHCYWEYIQYSKTCVLPRMSLLRLAVFSLCAKGCAVMQGYVVWRLDHVSSVQGSMRVALFIFQTFSLLHYHSIEMAIYWPIIKENWIFFSVAGVVKVSVTWIRRNKRVWFWHRTLQRTTFFQWKLEKQCLLM